MAASDPHFRLRVPEDLRAKIEESARRNDRSLNAEIVFRLKETFEIIETEEDRRLRDISQLRAKRAVAVSELTMNRAIIRDIDDRISAIISEREEE